MSSISEVPIPLMPDASVGSMAYVPLYRTITVNDVQEKRKEYVPCLNEEIGAEAALRHWIEFREAWVPTRLSFPNQGDQVGPTRFKYFRETPRGRAVQLWNTALAGTEGRLVQDFNAIRQEFWRHYIPQDAVQKHKRGHVSGPARPAIRTLLCRSPCR